MQYSDSSLGDSRIFIVDDNLANVVLVERLLDRAGFHDHRSESDSRLAIAAIEEYAPDLILLDLHMPHLDGYEILAQLRRDESEPNFLPILVFTADAGEPARCRALTLGASDFLTKPGNPTEILQRVRNFLRARKMHVALRDQNLDLEVKVRERTADLEEARMEILVHLAKAGEYRDDMTGEHTLRVGQLSGAIAKAIGMGPQQAELVQFAAQLHDIGKIGIPDEILLKPGALTIEEFAIMKRHTEIGGRILETSKAPLLKVAREIALFHHENWDGTGYQSGLRGEEIPLSARIVAVADVYDALTHARPYKKAWTQEDAFDEIRSRSGSKFDPAVVEAFFKCRAIVAEESKAA
jgi:putative two-component system response regulator